MLRICGATGLTFGLLTACTGVADVVTLALRAAAPSAEESEDSTYAPTDSGDASSEDWASVEEEVHMGLGGGTGEVPWGSARGTSGGDLGGTSGDTLHPSGSVVA